MKLLMSNIPCLVCLGISGYLVINRIDGWGWFLFSALINAHVHVSTEKDD